MKRISNHKKAKKLSITLAFAILASAFIIFTILYLKQNLTTIQNSGETKDIFSKNYENSAITYNQVATDTLVVSNVQNIVATESIIKNENTSTVQNTITNLSSTSIQNTPTTTNIIAIQTQTGPNSVYISDEGTKALSKSIDDTTIHIDAISYTIDEEQNTIEE